MATNDSIKDYITPGGAYEDTEFTNGYIYSGWSDDASKNFVIAHDGTASNLVSSRYNYGSVYESIVLYLSFNFDTSNTTYTIRYYLSSIAFTSSTGTTINHSRIDLYNPGGDNYSWFILYYADGYLVSESIPFMSYSSYRHAFSTSSQATAPNPWILRGTAGPIDYSQYGILVPNGHTYPGSNSNLFEYFYEGDGRYIDISSFAPDSKKYIGTKISGNWKKALPYVNINGTWKEAIPYIKVNGSWKECNYVG